MSLFCFVIFPFFSIFYCFQVFSFVTYWNVLQCFTIFFCPLPPFLVSTEFIYFSNNYRSCKNTKCPNGLAVGIYIIIGITVLPVYIFTDNHQGNKQQILPDKTKSTEEIFYKLNPVKIAHKVCNQYK